ncbi:replication initiator [Streptomyces humicola]|uniref:replication initiator n=1 Tax=Streptomyces humicola TaxID=2953240 RepID=UPI0027E300CA|nr:replication initiator [Streptomyces humicola]
MCGGLAGARCGRQSRYSTRECPCWLRLARCFSGSRGPGGGRPGDRRERRPRPTPSRGARGRPARRRRALDEFEDLRLRAWAHMLGFRGHVLTKSRVYSTTYGALRAARDEYQRETAGRESCGDADSETVTKSVWRYVGSGHTLGEAWFARGIAEERAFAREAARDDAIDGGRRHVGTRQAA